MGEPLPAAFIIESATLGAPHQVSPVKALSTAARFPTLTEGQEEYYGSRIYAGRLAATRLAKESTPIEVDEYFYLEKTEEEGQAARRIVATALIPMVLHEALRYNLPPTQTGDLIGTGHCALMACMDAYIHKPGRPLKPFVRICVRNAMLQELRSEKRHASPPRALYKPSDCSYSEELLETAEDTITAIKLWQLAQEFYRREKLTTDQWNTFVDYIYHGMTVSEITNTHGVTQARISERLRYIKERIRQEIRDPGSEMNAVDSTASTAAELLLHLKIAITPQTPIHDLAGRIIDEATLTPSQRGTLHVLFGTKGQPPLTLTELAKQRGVAFRSITKARKIAVDKIIAEWNRNKR